MEETLDSNGEEEAFPKKQFQLDVEEKGSNWALRALPASRDHRARAILEEAFGTCICQFGL